jgi:TolB protein
VGANIYEAELYIINADGSNLTKVANDKPGRLDSPSFSIDGSRMLYSRDVDGYDSVSGRQLNGHIFMQKQDGTGLVDLSPSSTSTVNGKPAGTNDLYPHFSPDGARIIFVNANNDGISPPEVWIMDLDGKNRVKLFNNASLPD